MHTIHNPPRLGRKFYRVGQTRGVWHFITPDGKPFFSAGVCCIDEGERKEKYNPQKPGYASFRHYPDTEAWAKTTVERLKTWNFNTIGGWSSEAMRHRGMPYTVVLHLGSSSTPSVPWGDLFSEETARTMDAVARAQILPLKDDPELLGWFTDNELGWWDESLFLYYFGQPENNRTRAVLMRLLREHYKNNFALFLKDFEVGKATRFEDLKPGTLLLRKPGGKSSVVMDQFTYLLTSQYYKLVHDTVRRYDKNHLILGDRYPGHYPAPVARAAAPYVDVISTNYGADRINGTLSRFYLDRLHRLTKKPILIGEYYFAAMENQSGNKNSGRIFPTVETQKERAAGFRQNLTELARRPYLIGAHWFQYTDEPTFGRRDGEDYNMGLVDINDRPYELLTKAATEVQGNIPQLRSRLAAFPAHRLAARNGTPAVWAGVREDLTKWPTASAYIESSNPYPFGDVYVVWTRSHLCLAVMAADFADGKLYAGGKMPPSERSLFTLKDSVGKSIRIRFGGGNPPEAENPEDAALILKFLPKSTTGIVQLAIPAARFGKQMFREGESCMLSASLVRHGSAERMDWNTTLKLLPQKR